MSDARVVKLNEYAAEWWAKIDRARRAKGRRSAASTASAQSLSRNPRAMSSAIQTLVPSEPAGKR